MALMRRLLRKLVGLRLPLHEQEHYLTDRAGNIEWFKVCYDIPCLPFQRSYSSERKDDGIKQNTELTNAKYKAENPLQCDVVIVGGGIIGMSCAYWLKQRNPGDVSVTVVEQDPLYKSASTVLSYGGIRSQFSVPENVQMSLFGSKFIRNINEHLNVKGMDPPDVQYCPNGYLILAKGTEADAMIATNRMQRELGANVVLLSRTKLKERWPWLNVDDIELGSFGLENEGWFDPWSYLMAFKQKARSLGVNLIKGKVVGAGFSYSKNAEINSQNADTRTLESINVLTAEDTISTIEFTNCVNAAGYAAGELAAMVGVGSGPDIRSVPLPIEKRKRYVYVVHAPNGPGVQSPLVIDYTGTCVRREGHGGKYLVYGSPAEEEDEPTTADLNVDYDFFHNKLWPELANRVPNMQELKVMGAWSGFFDYNYVDQNLIIGAHPYFKNFYFANGSSGHGLQHAAAIGRAVSELILDGRYINIDLERFTFQRMIVNEPVYETYII